MDKGFGNYTFHRFQCEKVAGKTQVVGYRSVLSIKTNDRHIVKEIVNLTKMQVLILKRETKELMLIMLIQDAFYTGASN